MIIGFHIGGTASRGVHACFRAVRIDLWARGTTFLRVYLLRKNKVVAIANAAASATYVRVAR
jgi:hypothetical protein